MNGMLWERTPFELQAHGAWLLGRYAETSGALRLRWSGSGISVRLRCRALYADIEAEYADQAIWLGVLVDGALIARFPLERGRSRVPLLLGLDGTEHTFSGVRETQPVPEEPETRCALHALLSDGEQLPLPEKPAIIEFIGDSLTCGEGCVGPLGASEWRTAYLSASLTWAQFAQNALGARGRRVSLGGWGVRYGWDGNPEHAIPRIYDAVCGVETDGGAAYDFDREPADIVAVNLGTNDQTAVATADEALRAPMREEIARAARAFLARLRERNPGALILWGYGMCGDPLADILRKAVEATGDARVLYVPLPRCREDELGSRGHPGPAAQRRAAQTVLEAIKASGGV